MAEFEKKLQEIKLKMESQRTEKKSFLKYFQSESKNLFISGGVFAKISGGKIGSALTTLILSDLVATHFY